VREKREIATLQSSNKFEILKSRVMNIGEESGKEVEKDRRMILREEKEKKKAVEIRKTAEEGKALREMTVKIRLERIDMQEGIIVEALLDSRAIELVMSSEFIKKQEFELKKIERPIYYQEYRERMEIDMISR